MRLIQRIANVAIAEAPPRRLAKTPLLFVCGLFFAVLVSVGAPSRRLL